MPIHPISRVTQKEPPQGLGLSDYIVVTQAEECLYDATYQNGFSLVIGSLRVPNYVPEWNV